VSECCTQLKVVKEENGIITLNNGLELAMSKVDFLLMQLLQNYVLEILLMIDDFCRKHNITYYLGEGTLLGALRHKGYIPWDDDVDLLMPREDYNRFLELAKTELPQGYQIDSYQNNPKHSSLVTFVQMTRKVPYVKKRQEGISLNIGPGLDIFPLDFVPDDQSSKLKKRAQKINLLRRAIWIKSGLHTKEWYNTIERRLKLYYPHNLYGRFHSLINMHEEAVKLMTETNCSDYDYLACFSSLYTIDKEVFPNDYFGKPRFTDFEGHQFPIPAQAEKVLQRIYGNYMAYPPVEKRLSKHFFSIDNEVFAEMKDDPMIKPIWDAIQESGGVIPEPDYTYGREYESTLVGLIRLGKKSVHTIYRKIRHIGRCVLRKINRAFGKIIASFKWVKFEYRHSRIRHYMKQPLNNKAVFYDAFSGLGILDSPRALFKGLLAREEFSNFEHFWTVANFDISKPNLKEFENLQNVKFTKRGTDEYIKRLLTSKYIICNSSVPEYFVRRPGQIYLNTWHGVPTKVMGYERPGQRVGATENIVHNFLNSTHIIAANHFTGERMFKQAYMLNGMYRGSLLDVPLPRTDMLYNTTRDEINRKLNAIGIPTDKKIILYAPTWKGRAFNDLEYDLDELKNAIKTLRERINTDEYNIYLRVHYFLYRSIQMDPELSSLCIPFTIDTDELLTAVDILISDYSSIFFDFLGTHRPILFYVPDLQDYSENRGLYIPIDELPGPVSEHLEDIADYINNIETVQLQYKTKYDAMYDWCSSREDGQVVNRVIDTVFLGKKMEIIDCHSEKEKIAILVDFSKSFQNQEQLISMLDLIDYEKYDVTLITGRDKKKTTQLEILENLNPNVRILINTKAVFCNLRQRKQIYSQLTCGKIPVKKAAQKLGMSKVWMRITGGAHFDKLFVVDVGRASAHWFLLASTAISFEKYALYKKTKNKSVFSVKASHKEFDRIYSSIDQMLLMLQKYPETNAESDIHATIDDNDIL